MTVPLIKRLPTPITIEIGGVGTKPFKSIQRLSWSNVPPFVVLTGLNGSGKTQLLELLAYRLCGIDRHPEEGNLSAIPVSIEGDTFEPDRVAYVPSQWEMSGAPSTAISEMQQTKIQIHSEYTHQHDTDFVRARRRVRLERMLRDAKIQTTHQDQFTKALPDDFSFMLDEVDVTTGLVHVFMAYRMRAAELREVGDDETTIRSKLGPPPWEVANETFAAASFPFRVVSPVGSKLLDRFELRLEDVQSKCLLRPRDLSSGERVLLALVLWLYSSNHHGRFPKLFLLDEPDAHLHPSMTRHFLTVLEEVLVAKYGVRVILTTHSPSTVALAPDASVFEMRRSGEPRIVPSVSKAESVGLLTAGLLVVSHSTRYVFVEDNDDVAFYEMVRDVLTDYGPTQDPIPMKPAPTVNFLSVSLGKSKEKIAGGKNVVMQWLEKLNTPPLSEMFRGVIDRDVANTGTNHLLVLGRYSIENYYLDPFVVFAVLSDQGSAPAVPSVSVPAGQEHLIRTLSVEQLQAIVDTVAARIEPSLGSQVPTEPRIAVSFTNGVRVEYPAWMINMRGHDLLPIYQACFGGATIVQVSRLQRSFKRVRLVPSELSQVMRQLQS